MIFITVGTQKFAFDRLIKEVDELASRKEIKEEIFAQTGYSEYKPKFIGFKQFLSTQEFDDALDKADLVISHGGTASIVKAIKKNKKVIAVPRLKEFNEHVDNHQTEITKLFHDEGHIIEIDNIKQLFQKINSIEEWKPVPFKSSNTEMVKTIQNFIAQS